MIKDFAHKCSKYNARLFHNKDTSPFLPQLIDLLI